MYCTNCGEKLNDTQDICLNCGVYVKRKNVEDDGSIGWYFLGLFVPLAGIIIYALWRKERPKSAKRSLYGFLTSIAILVILYISIILYILYLYA